MGTEKKHDVKWWIEAVRAILAVIAGLLGAGAYDAVI